jgi:hypothetical protein
VFRQITTILLLTAFVAQTFSSGFVLLDYYTNPVAFAQHCINKALPKMHCNGKCQLMKKIEAEEKKEQENTQRFGNLKMEVLSAKSCYPSLPILSFTLLTAVKNALACNSSTTDRSIDFFHPPKTV